MMSEEGIYIVGAGGHARVICSLLEACRRNVQAFIVDGAAQPPGMFLGRPVYRISQVVSQANPGQAIIAIGDNCIRSEKAEQFPLGWEFPVLIHPYSWIHDSADLDRGTVVFAGAVIQPDVCIGQHVIVNTRAGIDHDCRIGDFVHIGPGATVAGTVSIGARTLIGAGATIIPNINIGRNCIIGAGAAVTRDIPDNSTAVGVPARVQVK